MLHSIYFALSFRSSFNRIVHPEMLLEPAKSGCQRLRSVVCEDLLDELAGLSGSHTGPSNA